MGPNGSGKSTLAYSIAGHPKYTVTGGSVTLDGADVLAMSVDERARAGLFLAMQYPVEVPGVSVSNFLRTAETAIRRRGPKLRTWVKEVQGAMDSLAIDPSFAERNVNEGFSGGEKKRHEILQLELLKPKVAVLDETDSGLDIDALKVVSEGVNRVRATGEIGVLLITHYTRILRYIQPDFVHVFVDGRIVEEGGPELAEQLEAEGYEGLQVRHHSTMSSTMGRAMTDRSTRRWMSSRSARTSRSSNGGCPATGRWSTSTARPTRRRSRARSSRRSTTTTRHNANVHRGIHTLAEEATAAYEGAREKVAAFIGAPSREEVVFTKNSSEALNLVANVLAWARPLATGPGQGDEIVITEMEHHSNIVPWQLLAQRTGATLRWFGITDEGRLDLSDIDELITERTKVASVVYVSNILGTVNPVGRSPGEARAVGALSSWTRPRRFPSFAVDVDALGADFVAFTGHKMCGPTGIGVLWGRRELLDALPPFLGGGEMIADVEDDRLDLRGVAAQVRGRDPADRAGRRSRRRGRLLVRARHGCRGRARARAITAYALERLREIDGLVIVGPDTMVDAGERSRSPGRVSTRTTSARCSTSKGSRFASDTTARSRCAPASASGDDARFVLPVLLVRGRRRARRGPRMQAAEGTSAR